jgi:hypothetical protein
MKKVHRDHAVAYRAQIGREQWVLYRSLTNRANRTFISQNVSSEFFIGRFDSEGEVEELLQVE